jgi:hypothetical protein
MTTKKQIAANRRNAKRSTGPRTEEGKLRSSQNAMTHGLLSRQVLLKEEDPDRFREVWGALWEELRPEGELETYLAARIVSGIWRMNRIVRIEAQLFNEAPLRAVEPEAGIGKIFRLDCGHGGSAFAKLLRYETAIDRGIQRALRELRAVQAARRAGPEEDWDGVMPAAAVATRRNAPVVAGRGRGASAPPPREGTRSAEDDGTNGNLRKEPNGPPGQARQGSAGDRRPAGREPHPIPAGRAAPRGAVERELDFILGPPGAGGR